MYVCMCTNVIVSEVHNICQCICYSLEVCYNACKNISILTTKLSRLSKIRISISTVQLSYNFRSSRMCTHINTIQVQ